MRLVNLNMFFTPSIIKIDLYALTFRLNIGRLKNNMDLQLNTIIIKILLGSIVSHLCIKNLYSQGNFEFDQQIVSPASKVHFTIPMQDEERETFIPITIFHGKKAGPVVGITAGVHGYEYPPIMAGQQLISSIDPQELSGTIILVQVANVGGFLGRSAYLNPLDGKNLNRAFPGDPKGTITEKIADYISSNIITRCDYFLDMHGGDAPEDLMPYVGYYQHDRFPEISEVGKEMAQHTGFEHVVIFKTTVKDYMQEGNPSTYCSAQAFKKGIPSIDFECGKLGQSEDALVHKIVSGVKGLLHYLKMIEGKSVAREDVKFIEERSYLSSEHSGFFYPLATSGTYVLKGTQVGYVTDFFNKPLQEIYADRNGIVLLIIGTPPVNKNETVAVIGEL